MTESYFDSLVMKLFISFETSRDILSAKCTHSLTATNGQSFRAKYKLFNVKLKSERWMNVQISIT